MCVHIVCLCLCVRVCARAVHWGSSSKKGSKEGACGGGGEQCRESWMPATSSKSRLCALIVRWKEGERSKQTKRTKAKSQASSAVH